jgi:Tol biopolymer transport system component
VALAAVTGMLFLSLATASAQPGRPGTAGTGTTIAGGGKAKEPVRVPAMGRIIPRKLPPFIAFTYNTPTVYGISLVRPNGSDSHLIGPNEANASEPSWSPDGTKILYTTGCIIWAMNADGSNPRPLIPQDARPPGYPCRANLEHPRWSPNGKRIVYSFSGPGAEFARVANADGSHNHRVLNTDEAYDASLSPDGQYIVFGSYTLFDRQSGTNVFKPYIYLVRSDGTGLRRIITHGEAEDPSWSPDGTRILYSCAIYANPPPGHVPSLPTPHAICEISRAHPKPRTLYSGPSGGYFAAGTWSADGKKIVVSAEDATGTSEIALMAPSGGAPVAITHPPGYASDPDW